jgi:hypothetical protein
MKRFILFLVFSLSGILLTYSGEPVPGAEVYVEQTNNEPVAFQLTGNDGAVTFSHLNRGSYQIFIVLPVLKGKLVRDRDKITCDLKAGFHSEKKVYYLQETEGFFTLGFEDLKKVRQIIPVYNSQNRRGMNRICIGSFEVESDGGQVSLATQALTPREFEKTVEKAKHETAMNAIRNMR